MFERQAIRIPSIKFIDNPQILSSVFSCYKQYNFVEVLHICYSEVKYLCGKFHQIQLRLGFASHSSLHLK